MIDLVMTMLVVVLLAAGTALLANTVEFAMRRWVWIGFGWFMVCAIAQLLITRVINPEGGDTTMYTERSTELARYMETSFTFVAPEVFKLLIQQPSGVDNFPMIVGAGSNTGSMFGVAAFLIYFLAGSDIAAQVLVSGFSYYGALQIYKAFADAQPDLDRRKLFIGTVLFPSVGFWTAAMHKESFCLMGVGCCLAAWRGVYNTKIIRSIILLALGITLLGLFRPPVIPPIALGVAVFYLYERLRRSRGGNAIVLGPIYLIVAFAVLAAGMVLVSHLDPSLGIDKIGDTMSEKQGQWGKVTAGSTIDTGDADPDGVPTTPAAQLARVPFGLLNALLRPQLFDVHNAGTFLGALEMTVVGYLLFRAIYGGGVRGILREIEKSPLMLMCTVVTLVGCTFVGLVTLNLGSLARYRVPFLPFYATFVLSLARQRAPVRSAVELAPRSPLLASGPRISPRIPTKT